MANEAVIIELPLGGRPRRYTVADAQQISGGTLLRLIEPNTASGSSLATVQEPFAGIATMEKVANDGSTEISAYTYGVFDLTCTATGAVPCGAAVVMSGANLIRAAVAAEIISGMIIGKALEEGTANEVIRVAVGGLI